MYYPPIKTTTTRFTKQIVSKMKKHGNQIPPRPLSPYASTIAAGDKLSVTQNLAQLSRLVGAFRKLCLYAQLQIGSPDHFGSRAWFVEINHTYFRIDFLSKGN